MPQRALRWILLSGVALALVNGCGRSFLFLPVEEAAGSGTSSSGSGSGSSSSGSGSSNSASGGTTSSGGTCGARGDACSAAAACCSGFNCVRGTCRGGGGSGSGSGSASSGTVSSSSGSNGCTPGGPTTGVNPCTVASDCGCPYVCTPTLAGQSICEQPCQSTSDCSALYTTCTGGACQPNVCGIGGGQIDGLCNAVGQNDGTCLALSVDGFNVGLCYQGGTATASCSIDATRQNLSQDCVAGEFCAGAICEEVCNPNGSVPCTNGGMCVAEIASEPELGFCLGGGGSSGSGACSGPPPACTCSTNCVCQPVCDNGAWTCSEACTGGSSSGSGTSSSSGSSSSCGPPPICSCSPGCSCGSSCSNGTWSCFQVCGSVGGSSGSSSGGCNPQLAATELTPCQNSSECGCPTICVDDALAGQQVCEYPCTQTSDCPDLHTVCTGVSCTIDLCGVAIGGPPNGTLDGPCNSEGTDDGTCVPTAPADGGQTFGICIEGGTSQTNCSTSATRSDLSQACAEGYICGQGLGSSNVCYVVCNPTVSSSVCKSNQTCTAFDASDPELGVCYP